MAILIAPFSVFVIQKSGHTHAADVHLEHRGFSAAACFVPVEKIGRLLFVCDNAFLGFDAPQHVPMLDGCLAEGTINVSPLHRFSGRRKEMTPAVPPQGIPIGRPDELQVAVM